jgi:hypothetical protein
VKSRLLSAGLIFVAAISVGRVGLCNEAAQKTSAPPATVQISEPQTSATPKTGDKLESLKGIAEGVKNVAEALALVCAACFFIYKLIAGYLFTDLSVKVEAGRCRILGEYDVLVITATLKKGERGSVQIHDAQVRISYDNVTQDAEIIPMLGFLRLSYGTENLGKKERQFIKWKISETAPLLRIPPNEEAQFSCHTRVHPNAICSMELVVLGREWSGLRVGQWRSSQVCAPLAESNQNAQTRPEPNP